MIIDHLKRAHLYRHLHAGFDKAFHYLETTDLHALPAGKYPVDGDNIFAIVQEYDTMDAATEQMESHKKYIDIQYMIQGTELVGHAIPGAQTISKPYEDETDFMLFADAPSFFTEMNEGTFMIFFPTDPHMPCIKTGEVGKVKKVVVKVNVVMQ